MQQVPRLRHFKAFSFNLASCRLVYGLLPSRDHLDIYLLVEECVWWEAGDLNSPLRDFYTFEANK